MSLYYEASELLQNSGNIGGSLKSRIYRQETLRSSPSHIYALISEAIKWSEVLREVIEKSGLLKEEKKLTPTLALLLVHDFLLAKNAIAAPGAHALTLAVGRHKARLRAELTKVRLRRGFSTLEAFRNHVNSESGSGQALAGHVLSTAGRHPRWVRINTLRTTLEDQLETTFAGYEARHTLASVLAASPTDRIYHVDAHIPDLIALPPQTDLSKERAYMVGELIIQDKASCFPAYLLDPKPEDESVIDACAAPGNKTTHLAALLSASYPSSTSVTVTKQRPNTRHQQIIAFERDQERSKILQKMVTLAKADKLATIRSGQDFLQQDPKGFRHVGALLLDPSCSGSGIVGRDQFEDNLVLPNEKVDSADHKGQRSRKRKRADNTAIVRKGHARDAANSSRHDEEPKRASDTATATLTQRLKALSEFQVKLLQHAMQYPNARKITYSTCSIHAEENERVVVKALHSPAADGWRILRRNEQVEGLKGWPIRGQLKACKGALDILGADEKENSTRNTDNAATIAEACIRCEKGTKEGTMGFFVAGFVKDDAESTDQEEWRGFSDDESNDTGS